MGGGAAASSSSVHSTATKSHTPKQQPVQRTKPRTPIKKMKTQADADDMSDENDDASSSSGEGEQAQLVSARLN
jgi:hypothetical protein